MVFYTKVRMLHQTHLLTEVIPMTPDISIAWLLLNVVVITITVVWGIYRYRRGIWYRKLSLKFQAYLLWGIGGLALLSSFYPYAFLYTEHLWNFEGVGYPGVFWKIIKVRWGLFFGFFFAALLFMNLNAVIAKRLCPEPREFSRWVHDQTVSFHRAFFCGSILIAIIFAVPMMSLHDEYILYRGQPKEEKVAPAIAEQQDTEKTNVDQEATGVIQAELEDDEIANLEQLDTEIADVSVSQKSETESLFFGKDVNFYLFSYPMHKAVSLWIQILFIVTCGIVGLLYNFYYRRDARSMGYVKRNIVLHGSILWLMLLAVAIWRGYVNLWGKVYTPSLSRRFSEFYGLFYADWMHVGATRIYSIILIMIGIVVIFNLFWRRRIIWYILIAISMLSYICLIHFYPHVVNFLAVRTAGEAESVELKYLRSHIKDTRDAFDLNTIHELEFNKGLVTLDTIKENPDVMHNIQFWDRRIFYNILRNQEIKRHHDFHPYADVDRYRLNPKQSTIDPILESQNDVSNGSPAEAYLDSEETKGTEQYRQVLIAAREIDPDPGPREWGELKLKFTHGYGVCVAPVNEIVNKSPDLWVKGIPVTQKEGLQFKELDVSQPRIYYGEMTDDYVIVNTQKPEYNIGEEERIEVKIKPDLDENSENESDLDENATEESNLQEDDNDRANLDEKKESETIGKGYHYDGSGGVRLGGLFRRLCFAVRFTSVYILRNSLLQHDSRVMYWRKIGTRDDERLVIDRLSHIAPFLDYDPDPYIVIDKGQLWWLVDFYITNRNYPNAQFYKDDTAPIEDNDLELYTEPRFKRFKKFNYIRNSGVAVVNAYNGEVNFYTEDNNEMIIGIYQKAFPNLFKKMSEMPEGLKSHRRFPDYLTRIQAKMYGNYHVKDPETFFNKDNQWNIPIEAYYSETPNHEMMPYYAMLKLPGEDKVEFVNMVPFTPPKRENFMKGWMIARCDPPNYGQRIVFTLPGEVNVEGPKHVENDISKNSTLAGLFKDLRDTNQIIRGNQHVIPIEEGIFFIKPIFLKPKKTKGTNGVDETSKTDPIQDLPTLTTIVVKAADHELGYDINFDVALRKVFIESPTTTSIPETEDEEKAPTTLEHLDALAKAIEDLRKAYINEQNGAGQTAAPKNQGKKKQNKQN